MWNNVLTRGLLDGWQLSGDTACVSGDWSGATTSTTDNFDFTGGDGGTRPRISGDTHVLERRQLRSDAGRHAAAYFNVSAFSRLTGRGDIGNAPVTFYRLPKIVLSNMSIFKNFQLGGGKRIQFRWEAYNVFNQVNWSALNTNAQFNPAGQQVNASFGQATAVPQRARHAGGDRFSF